MNHCCKVSKKKSPLLSVTFVGLANAGKTTLIQRLQDYIDETVPTIGSNSYSIEINVPALEALVSKQNAKTLKMRLFAFDTAGQEEERERWCHHYRDIDALVFVIDGNEFYDAAETATETIQLAVVKETTPVVAKAENKNDEIVLPAVEEKEKTVEENKDLEQKLEPALSYRSEHPDCNGEVLKEILKSLYEIAKDPNLLATPILIVINKRDLVNARDRPLDDYTIPLCIDFLEEKYGFSLPDKKRFTVVPCSAVDGSGIDQIKIWLYNQAISNVVVETLM